MKRILRDYRFLALLAGLIVALDQYTKYLVRTQLEIGQSWAPWDWLYPYARIVHISNTGVAFGMFQGANSIFIVLALLVSLAIIYYFPRIPSNEWIVRVALGLQLAGATGNLIDRITQGHVTDFVSVGTFAVFNVADASISVGVAVLLLGVWIQDRHIKKQASNEKPEDADDSSRNGEALHFE